MLAEEERHTLGANARIAHVCVGDILLLADLPRVGLPNLEGGTFNVMHVHADGTFDTKMIGANRWQKAKDIEEEKEGGNSGSVGGESWGSAGGES